MPVLLVMDLLGIAAFRKDFDRRLLLFLLPLLLVVHRYRTPSGAALPHEESRP